MLAFESSGWTTPQCRSWSTCGRSRLRRLGPDRRFLVADKLPNILERGFPLGPFGVHVPVS